MSPHAFRRTAGVWSKLWRIAWVAIAGCAAFPPAAMALFISTSSVDTGSGTVRDTGSTSSAVAIDADNFARSFSRPQQGTVGAGASNSTFGAESFSRSRFDDSWTCQGPCAVVGPVGAFIVPLSLDFRLDGVLTHFFRLNGFGTGTPEINILARYEIGVLGLFEFRLRENVFDFAQGPLGAGSSVSAKFCRQGSSNCTALPVDIVAFTDANDNDLFRFSLNATSNQLNCPGCAAGFVDKQSIQVSVVGGNEIAMVDALNTFAVTVNSLDPTVQFVSAAGRTTGGTVSTTVPEPGTLGLLGLGLAGVGFIRRKRKA